MVLCTITRSLISLSLSLSFSSLAQCVVQFDLPEQYPDQPPLFTLFSVTPPSIPSQTILDLLEEQVGVTSPVLEIFLLFIFPSNFLDYSPWGSKNRIASKIYASRG